MAKVIDHSGMRLGRKAVKTDSRTLMLARYMTALPAPPKKRDWSKGITNWGMMKNDQLGDCTIAGAAHAIQVWTANTSNEVTLTDDQVVAAYEKWDGYNPADPATDHGGVELDVLKLWQKQGLDGHKLVAFADPSVKNLTEIRQAINLFGGVYIGLSLPLSAQNQDVWDVVKGPKGKVGSWGGHCVFVMAYDDKSFTCVTWGMVKKMTVAFWKKYCDEAHALLGQDWLAANKAPSGFDLAQLQADLAALN